MRLIKLIVPTALIAMIAMLAPRADAQTMGEYAGATASLGTSGGSMGTSLLPSTSTSGDVGGGSSTWGANGLGASFDERAGAASASAGGSDFESRAGSTASGSGSDSRWGQSAFENSSSGGLGGDSSTRWADSADRFTGQDRFSGTSQLSSSSDRFPSTALDNNTSGLDQHYDQAGLDSGGSTAGLSD
jgi:hypothetical protein